MPATASRRAPVINPTLDLHCRILYVGMVTIDASWDFPLCNPFWRLYVNQEDGASITSPTGKHPLAADRIALVPAWGKFHSNCVGAVRHFYVHFDPLGLGSDWAREHFTHPIILPALPARDQMVAALRDTIEATPTWRVRMQALLLDCLASAIEQLPIDVLSRFDRQSGNNDPVAPALKHIEGNLHVRLPIPALARLCDLSVDHFSRVFRIHLGQTPSHYIQERRIAIAAERLIASHDDIARIATDTGFANRYHFTRVFTSRMGVPPATYRRTGHV